MTLKLYQYEFSLFQSVSYKCAWLAQFATYFDEKWVCFKTCTLNRNNLGSLASEEVAVGFSSAEVNSTVLQERKKSPEKKRMERGGKLMALVRIMIVKGNGCNALPVPR